MYTLQLDVNQEGNEENIEVMPNPRKDTCMLKKKKLRRSFRVKQAWVI